jgi:hypothetical protein
MVVDFARGMRNHDRHASKIKVRFTFGIRASAPPGLARKFDLGTAGARFRDVKGDNMNDLVAS